MSKNLVVYGSGWQAAQSALTLADLGIDVDLITPSAVLDVDCSPAEDGYNHWPLLLRAAVHPRIRLITHSTIKNVKGQRGELTIGYTRSPRYVKEELCTACAECEKVCSVKIDSHTAICKPVAGAKSVPSTYIIQKDGISPCRGGCPLEINVHGYVSLIRQGKTAKALNLINQTAPLAGILGRLCTHPCETKCSRQDVDKPLFIQALHRYAADNAGEEIVYTAKTSGRHPQKIAVIGSGPAGLTAAWELARRGYSPTVFESHPVAGGMLAVGIPGFRLPSAVRQKEIAAIQKLGVEIKTGLTFGRDITADSLQKDGYQALFLAIGAHSNNRLNIPGENLAGVVDCIAWLHDFNAHPEGRLDEKIVVIGGGNSAVDSARSAKRLTGQDVRILCLTAEMTAVPEEVEEAVKEGIPIDYNNSALEIMGQNGRVTGLRCIKVRNVQFDSEGRISLERLEGSEYIVPADKVIIAIGQRPDSARLNFKGLALARNATITADPLTLQTNLPGVFAGGDAVSGSKNVVSAMAAGLRAAESIDRFIQGQALDEGRTLDPLKTVEIEAGRKKVPVSQRVKMPALPVAKRHKGSSETSLGLSAALAAKESSRCLDCAGCCECLECETVCEVKAVNHADLPLDAEIKAAALLDLSDSELLSSSGRPGIYPIKGLYNGDSSADMARAAAAAFKAALDLKLAPPERRSQPAEAIPAGSLSASGVSVFLCSCGAANSSVLDFNALAAQSQTWPGVKNVHIIAQSCTPEGAAQIKEALLQDGAAQAVLAACRCCNWDQACFSCADRRVMCRRNLNAALPAATGVEYVNIREMCAWLYRDDPAGATRNAAELISAAVKRAARSLPDSATSTPVAGRALIISAALSGLSAAAKLAAQGYAVTLLSNLDAFKIKSQAEDYRLAAAALLKEITALGVETLPWPEELILNGAPGRYEAVLKFGLTYKTISAGCVILDIAQAPLRELAFLNQSNLLSRVIRRLHADYKHPGRANSRMYHYSIGETAAMLFINPAGASAWPEQITAGEAAAARASAILSQESLRSRGSSVIIHRPLCRGCGDCAAVCSLIEIKPVSEGLCYAEVDPALCLGCGQCVSACPTGAITQPAQDEAGIEAALESIFKAGTVQ